MELSQLTRYWSAFPDTYFRFGMFLKDYTDKEKMKSFVLQGACYKFSVDKKLKYNILIDDKNVFHDIIIHYGLTVPTRYFTFRGGELCNGAELMTDAEMDTVLKGIADDYIFRKEIC